jgi:sugar lactone lactonase YvrE
VGGLNSPANGIVLGPDGNIWAAEEAAGSVVRMTPSGQVLAHYPVGTLPTSMAVGPGDRVWVSVTGADKLVWFDATSLSPSAHDVSTGAGCGPVGIVSGGDGQMYFSQPSDGVLCGVNQVGHVNADGSGGLVTTALLGGTTPVGQAFALGVSGGKLFIPDFEGDVVRRAALGTLAPEATIDTPAGSAPDGIAADGAGNLWVTLYVSGQLARFPAGQASGSAATLTPTGATLSTPFGIVAGADSSMYVASSGNARLLGVTAAPSYSFTALPFDAEPWQLTNGPNNDLWVTDVANSRLLRVSNDPGAGGPGGPGPGRPAPKLTLSGRKVQKLGRFVVLKASCGADACTASATGALKVPSAEAKGSAAKQLKLKPAGVHIAAGHTALLKLKIPAKARKAAAEALQVGKKPVAKIKARATAAGVLTRPLVRRVTLKS